MDLFSIVFKLLQLVAGVWPKPMRLLSKIFHLSTEIENEVVVLKALGQQKTTARIDI